MNFRISTFIFICYLVPVFFLYSAAHSTGQNTAENANEWHFSDVTFTITGTSNVRDWEIATDELTGMLRTGPAFAGFAESSDNPDQWFEEVSLSIPKESLDSGNSMMNQTMLTTFKSDEHPYLKYRVISVEEVKPGSNSDERIFLVDGSASAAGAEHGFKHEVSVQKKSSGSYLVYGTFDIKMTDLNMEPPTFMRGALKTADDTTVAYKFTITKD